MSKTQSDLVEVRTVLVSEVYSFICSYLEQADSETVIPITRRKALAWSKNPEAEPGDIALYLAYLNGKCIGYGGVIPSRTWINGKSEKIEYGSMIYVHPKYRRLSVAEKIIKTWVNRGGHCLVTDPDPDNIGRFYNKESTATYLGNYHSCVLHFNRLNPLTLLRGRLAGFLSIVTKLTQLEEVIQKGIRFFVWWITQFKYRRIFQKYGIEKKMDDWDVFPSPQEKLCRTEAGWKWLISHPWALLEPKEQGVERNHFFFSKNGRFTETVMYKIVELHSGNVIGKMIVSKGVRNSATSSKVRVLDVFVSSSELNYLVFPLSLKILYELSGDHLQISKEFVPQQIALTPLAEIFERIYFYLTSSKTSRLFDKGMKLQFSEGDGEMGAICI